MKVKDREREKEERPERKRKEIDSLFIMLESVARVAQIDFSRGYFPTM